MQPEVVQTHPYIDQWRAHGFQYFIIPKAMLRDAALYGMGMDEVVLYAILRDRASLSVKNNWINAKGQVFIIFPRAAAAEYIGWSQRKTIDVFARLVEAGLLTEEIQPRQNGAMNKPKKLYVHQWAEHSIIHSVEALKNGGFPYLTQENICADTGEYYILPRCLFEDQIYDGLSLRAIILYIIALDKLSLSISYGRIDDNGLVWCSLKTPEVCKEIGCSDRSLREAYKELETIGLMVRKRNGSDPTIPYRIYLRDYLPPPGPNSTTEPADAENTARQHLHQAMEDSAPSTGSSCTKERQSLHPETANSAPPPRQDLQTSYPSSHPSLSTLTSVNLAGKAADAPVSERKNIFSLSIDEAYGHYQEQVQYPYLCDDINIAARPWAKEQMYRLLDLCIEIMAKDMLTRGLYIRIGTETIKKQLVLSQYENIDRYILFTLLEKVEERITEIKNPELYLHKALVSATQNHEGEAFYTRRKIEQARAHMLKQSPDTDS